MWLAILLCSSQIAYASNLDETKRLYKEGQYSQALESLNSYLSDTPNDSDALFLKGLVYNEQNRTEDAIKVFTALIEDHPELPEPYNNLAVLYANKGEYEKAKLALEMALKTHPSYATAYENLGDIYAKMASEAYGRALQLDNHSAATQTRLTMIKELFRNGGHINYSSSNTNHSVAIGATSVQSTSVEEVNGTVVNLAAPQKIVSVSSESIPSPTLPELQKEVLETVNAWAAAWSSQDVENYLSFYASDFKTPNNENRILWDETRRKRVTTPEFIKVSITNVIVNFNDAGNAEVSFHQAYRASHLKASGKKTLLMVKSGDKWLIHEERSR